MLIKGTSAILIYSAWFTLYGLRNHFKAAKNMPIKWFTDVWTLREMSMLTIITWNASYPMTWVCDICKMCKLFECFFFFSVRPCWGSGGLHSGQVWRPFRKEKDTHDGCSLLHVLGDRITFGVKGKDSSRLIPMFTFTGMILDMGSANERGRYIIAPPLIGWAHYPVILGYGRDISASYHDSLYRTSTHWERVTHIRQ